VDLDELIRTELTAQASHAPDPASVLAGVPARARARRHRRIAVAAAAAAVVLATALPYAAVRTHRSVAPAAPTSVALSWAPTWKPPGFSETFRAVTGSGVEGRLADLSRTKDPAIVWSAAREKHSGSGGAPVAVGSYPGFWIGRDGQAARPGERPAELMVRLEPDVWAHVSVLGPMADPEGTAVRLGGSFRRGGADIDVPVRFDRLPAGFAVDLTALSADGGASDAWNVQWALAGRGSRVAVNATQGRPEEVRYPHETARTPVRIGSRTGSWVTVRGGNLEQRLLQVPLGDGVTLILGERKVRGDVPVPEPVIELIAAGAVRLPADYSWMDR
jgi:hypothetical protein